MKAAEQRQEIVCTRILACLETCGPSSTKTIARLTQISKPAVGNTIGNLLRRGGLLLCGKLLELSHFL